jgi:hypothetical protein
MKVEISFYAMAHFHTEVELTDKEYKLLKSAGSEILVNSDPEKHELLLSLVADLDSFDHIEHDADIDELKVKVVKEAKITSVKEENQKFLDSLKEQET